ncbi:acylphosphatase [Candidatus Woesearchaeota archaeon]|nr:acylphosphatase [Candidatus Woesearchaeota archaeon]
MIKRYKIIISGKVQGVFFRRFIYESAVKLGLKGFVRNTEDGKVEAVFEGKKEDINKIIELCRKGPAAAKIENIKIINERALGEKEFVRKN